jgi:hypothetical protein
VAEEHERVAAETAVIAARAVRLAMVELAAARAQVEVAVAVDAARAVAGELEALHGSSTNSSVSADGGTDDELKRAREAEREYVVQWEAVHPQGHGGSSLDECGRASGAPGGGAHCGRNPDGSGSSNRRGRAGGWVNEDQAFTGRVALPHRRIQAIVRDVGPCGGWPTRTKTNYVEWATVMRIQLQVQHM